MQFGLRQATILFGVLVLIHSSESQTNSVTKGCETCSPSWLKLLPQYFSTAGVNGLPAGGKMCAFARNQTLFAPCDRTTKACTNKNGVIFKCCEIKCLTAIQPCFDKPLGDSYCIPSNLGPWMSTLLTLFWGVSPV